MNIKYWLLIPVIWIVLVFSGQTQAFAYDYKAGMEAYQAGHYERAYEIWHDLASYNDMYSQFSLGVMYSEGKGVKRDYIQSVVWYEKASAQGYSPAQYNLGNAYKFGRGVKQDDERAVYYWQIAATQDFAPAQNNLATALYFGRGAKQDKKKAEYWYRKSAAGGYKPANEKIAFFGVVQTDSENTVSEIQELSDFDKKLANDKKWILKQNTDSYTIQVLASPLPDSINSYLKEHKILDTVKIFAFHKDNRQWYAVLYGIYMSKIDARNADKGLSEQLKIGNGWVRKISAIQDILKTDI